MITFLKKVLGGIAVKIIQKHDPDVIAITGSVGKTSAKDAIFAVISNKGESNLSGKERWQVRKSQGNFNNEIGIPLNIISSWRDEDLKIISREQQAGTKKFAKLFFWLKAILRGYYQLYLNQSDYPEILILEYGADRPGDIKYLLRIARPKIAVITAVGEAPVHVEFYENAEAVAREKARLVEPLSTTGWAVLNIDDERVLNMKEKTRAQIMTFGFDKNADVKINQFEYVSFQGKPAGIKFKIEYKGSFVPVLIKNAFGRPQAYSVATAFAVGLIYGLNLIEIAELIEKYYLPAKRRMNLIEGVKDSWIIDDSYNASPLSMREALEALKGIPAKRKIAVLGDMLELGDMSTIEHEKLGKIVKTSADILVAVGPRAKLTAGMAIKSGMSERNIFSFDVVEDCLQALQDILEEGDLVLIKASRAIGLDKAVEEIKKM